jgi:protein phosphatase
MLADGMGGHQAGEVAAGETVKALCRIFKKRTARGEFPMATLDETSLLLKRAIMYVNGRIFKLGRAQEELKGMGTTLCCLLFQDDQLIIAHVGDSRIYRFRKNTLVQLTKDHSLLSNLVDQGQLSTSQASDFVYKNIITKAIGTEPRVEPTVSVLPVEAADVYMMCSDGLSDLVGADEIAKILATAPSLASATEQLIATANLHGGRDNITVVLTHVEGPHEAQHIPR